MAKRALRGIVDGTTYRDDTPKKVIDILERSRATKERICLVYGDRTTGKSWGDRPECGHVGRSMGEIKIPLLIASRRSFGGGGILDHAIVEIRTAKGKRLLYKHASGLNGARRRRRR